MVKLSFSIIFIFCGKSVIFAAAIFFYQWLIEWLIKFKIHDNVMWFGVAKHALWSWLHACTSWEILFKYQFEDIVTFIISLFLIMYWCQKEKLDTDPC